MDKGWKEIDRGALTLPAFPPGCRAGAIACTQPRRVAAVTVAARVAEEMGTQLGQQVRFLPPPALRGKHAPRFGIDAAVSLSFRNHPTTPQVGYAIRFEDVSGPQTRIRYCTDGLLLREAIGDPLLSKYSVVIVDEAHERTVSIRPLAWLTSRALHRAPLPPQVQTDVLLGMLKQVAARRKAQGDDDFRLLVMSATLDAQRFAEYFGGAPVAYVQGRQHPVEASSGKAAALGREAIPLVNGVSRTRLPVVLPTRFSRALSQVYYTPAPEDDVLDAALNTLLQLHCEGGPGDGDILVFLTGQEEIETMQRLVEQRLESIPQVRNWGEPGMKPLPYSQQLPPPAGRATVPACGAAAVRRPAARGPDARLRASACRLPQGGARHQHRRDLSDHQRHPDGYRHGAGEGACVQPPNGI